MAYDKSALESCSHLWSERRNDFVLLKVEGSDRASTKGCLIYSIKEHSTLVLEDELLAQEVMARMRGAGVKIVFREELPPGENELERTINEMLESGKTPEELNAAIRARENA